jgi:hypothetical protein
VKRQPVTSATVARVRIDDKRAGSPSSSIQTYTQSWISTAGGGGGVGGGGGAVERRRRR